MGHEVVSPVEILLGIAKGAAIFGWIVVPLLNVSCEVWFRGVFVVTCSDRAAIGLFGYPITVSIKPWNDVCYESREKERVKPCDSVEGGPRQGKPAHVPVESVYQPSIQLISALPSYIRQSSHSLQLTKTTLTSWVGLGGKTGIDH